MSTFVLIEKYTVGAGGASSVTLGSGGTIPQTYTDLVVKASVRTAYSGNYDDIYIKFNNNTSSQSAKMIYGYNGSTGSYSPANGTGWGFGTGDTATASTFGTLEWYVPNYTSSNYKSASIDSASETNAATAITALAAGLWSNTAAITSIVFVPYSGGGTSFKQYSTFYLYGILKA
jgi:hypothetical protein